MQLANNKQRGFAGKSGLDSINAKPIKYKGKLYTANQLEDFDECEVSSTTLRMNMNDLRKKVANGEAKYCDEEVLKCMKVKIREKKIQKTHTQRKEEQKEIEEKEKADWDLLNELWKTI